VELTGLKARMEQAEVVNSALAAQVNLTFVVFARHVECFFTFFVCRYNYHFVNTEKNVVV
jgi:hypothetical protein